MKYFFRPTPYCRFPVLYQLASSAHSGNNDSKMSEAVG